MWDKAWRLTTWNSMPQYWDVIIIGGGITGAGILREAQRSGLRCLLVEAHDFAAGASSRSSKLVHGGFRYLKNGQIRLTLESVSERERLQKEARGLVNPLGFLLANYAGDKIPGWVFGAGLICYDLLALKWGHRHYDALDMHEFCPLLTEDGLQGGYRYFDAQTDDARLVLRLIQEAVSSGGIALNYTRAISLLTTNNGQVCGVLLQDETPEGKGRRLEVQARVVINATGAWADDLRMQIGGSSHLRKLRGSHLVFSNRRLPLTRAVTFLHPRDGRPVFALPWEGVTMFGTTDVDQESPKTGLPINPQISPDEIDYLLQAVQFAFPNQDLEIKDVQSTFSGIRPVINTGKADPSKESREHVLWYEKGLLTITGGKLTTFRLMAHQALRKIRAYLPEKLDFPPHQRLLAESPTGISLPSGLTPAARLRLIGRHGLHTQDILEAAADGELEPIGNSATLWVELRWAARAEAVVHLDDLLLRRARVGLLLPRGGLDCMDQIRKIAQPELNWNDDRWLKEIAAYSDLWNRCYHLG